MHQENSLAGSLLIKNFFALAFLVLVTINADDKALLHPHLNKPTRLPDRDA
jgi:hypothetical protein